MAKSNRLVICQGLPASGKSTWARQQILAAPGQVKVLNRDSLRAMCDAGVYSKGNEKHIRAVEITLAEYYLRAGFMVIIDDTNLIESTRRAWREVAEHCHVPYVLQDFTHIPVEICIERDRFREHSVGEHVIRRMATQAGLLPSPTPPAVDPALPWAILCDMDGTLAHLNGRDPYNAATCEEDLLNEAVDSVLIQYHAADYQILLVSGRMDTWRSQTEHWLAKHGVAYHHLWMRPAARPQDPDEVIKREIYETHIAGRYNVRFVLDDRNRVVALWRALGLHCFQVADGDF